MGCIIIIGTTQEATNSVTCLLIIYKTFDYVYVCMYCIYVLYVCIVCMYVCMYVCVCVCVCVYIYIYIYIYILYTHMLPLIIPVLSNLIMRGKLLPSNFVLSSN